MTAVGTSALAAGLWLVAPAPAEDPRGAPEAAAVAAPDDAQAPTTVDPTPRAPAPAPAPAKDVPVERDGPPFYTEADSAALRQRFGLTGEPPTKVRKVVFRCLIADPLCGFNAEVNATSAYAYRMRQGKITTRDDVLRWNSGRAQYDLWVNFPVVVETVGRIRYNRMTLGPKGGIIISDSDNLWGNVGLAGRVWLGRGRLAPTIEFTSALSFQLRGQDRDGNGTMKRSPAGFTADVGVGLGGFGAIVFGGQYDTPLAREEVPEELRVAASGMFYVGFRGNIIWGAPAAAAVATHAVVQRRVEAP